MVPARGWRRRWTGAIRLVVAVLALVVAAGPAGPLFARMIGGPPAHACHCDARGGHATCACPICFPELTAAEDPSADPSTRFATGVCGDDDPAWRTLAPPAVPASGFVPAPLALGEPASFAPAHLVTQWSHAPDPRPPRDARA